MQVWLALSSRPSFDFAPLDQVGVSLTRGPNDRLADDFDLLGVQLNIVDICMIVRDFCMILMLFNDFWLIFNDCQ